MWIKCNNGLPAKETPESEMFKFQIASEMSVSLLTDWTEKLIPLLCNILFAKDVIGFFNRLYAMLSTCPVSHQLPRWTRITSSAQEAMRTMM